MNSRSRSLYAVARPSVVCLSVVCLSSVTLVHPTHPFEISGTVSSQRHFDTLAICPHLRKMLQRSSQGTSPSEELNSNIVILHPSKAISRKRCKTGNKLLLIANTQSYMSFRLVPKSTTLNDRERPNGVIVRYFTEFCIALGRAA